MACSSPRTSEEAKFETYSTDKLRNISLNLSLNTEPIDMINFGNLLLEYFSRVDQKQDPYTPFLKAEFAFKNQDYRQAFNLFKVASHKLKGLYYKQYQLKGLSTLRMANMLDLLKNRNQAKKAYNKVAIEYSGELKELAKKYLDEAYRKGSQGS